MSHPYPEDRTREKRTKGQQPYKDARQKYAESEVELETEAERYGETHQEEAGKATAERLAESLREETRRIIEERERGGEQPGS